MKKKLTSRYPIYIYICIVVLMFASCTKISDDSNAYAAPPNTSCDSPVPICIDCAQEEIAEDENDSI